MGELLKMIEVKKVIARNTKPARSITIRVISLLLIFVILPKLVANCKIAGTIYIENGGE